MKMRGKINSDWNWDSILLAEQNYSDELFSDSTYASESSETDARREYLTAINQNDAVSFTVSAPPEAGSGTILLSTLWDQSGTIFSNSEITYNEYCPIDPQTKEHSVTGCTNTAAGQILYYWAEHGLDLQLTLSSSDAYTSDYSGRIIVIDGTEAGAAANGYLSFAKVNAAIADFQLNSAEDIAALNFAVGVVQKAGYSSPATGTAWNTDVFYRAGMASAYYVSSSINSLFVSGGYSNGYITDAGFEVLIENLLAGRPVGTSYPGHALVIDGYNAQNDTFHINYGWGTYTSSTRWYTRTEMRNKKYYDFIIDIMPTYDGAPIEVTDSRIYGVGTLLRAAERAKAIQGKNTIVFSDFVKGAEVKLPSAILMDEVDVKNFNMNVAFADLSMGMYLTAGASFNGFSGSIAISNETSNCESIFFPRAGKLTIHDFSGSLISNAKQYAWGIYLPSTSTASLELNMNGGGIFAGSYVVGGTYSAGIAGIRNALDAFQTTGKSAIKAYETAAVGYSIEAGVLADKVALDNRSVILGNIVFGKGNDTLTVSNGSYICGALSFGEGSETFKIDNSSSVDSIFYAAGENVSVTITVNSAATGAGIINLKKNAYNFTSSVAGDIILDLTKAGDGEYILFDASGASYADKLKNLNFTVMTASGGSTHLSLASGIASMTGASLAYRNSSVVLTVTGSQTDVVAPSVPTGLVQSVSGKNVTLDWADSTDNVGVSGYRFRYGTTSQLAGDGSSVTVSNAALSGLSAGTYYWQVRAYDAAGNSSAWSAVKSFVVDITIPVPEIKLMGNTSVPARSVSLSASTNDGSPLYYNTVSADYSGPWTLYSATITVTANATYFFKATGTNGKTGTKSIVFTNIDTVAPEITGIKASTNSPTNQAITVSAEFSDNLSLASKQYRIGSGNWQTYTGAVTVSENTTIVFKAVDVAGNETTKEFIVTNIDKTAPVISGIKASTELPTNQSITVSAEFSDNMSLASKQYRIGSGNWQTYTGAVTVSENTTIVFKAVDVAGNETTKEFIVSNIDKTAPVISGIKVSTELPTNQSITVSAEFSDNLSLASKQYRIGSGNWQTYTGAVTVSENTTVSFKAVDVAGNETTKEFVVSNIDKTAPVISGIKASTDSPTNLALTVSAEFSDDVGLASKQYRIGSGNWQIYTGAVTVTENSTVAFKAVDLVGNETTKEFVVANIDKIAPEIFDLVQDVTKPTNGAVTVTAKFSDAHLSESLYSFDAKTWMKYVDGVTVSENRILYFKAVDTAGNETRIQYVVSNIDKTAPVISGLKASTELPTNHALTVSAVFFDNVKLASAQYRIGSSEWMAYTGAVTVSENTIVHFRAVDTAGNETTQEFAVTNIDRTAPVISDLVQNVTKPTNGTVTVTAKFSDAHLSGAFYSFDAKTWMTYEDGVTVSENRTVYFKAVDAAGNEVFAQHEVANIDNLIPELVLSVDNTDANSMRPVTITAFASDASGIARIEYSIDSNDVWEEYVSPLVCRQNGTYRFRAVDAAGNMENAAYTVLNIFSHTEKPVNCTVAVKKYDAVFKWSKYVAAKGVKVSYEVRLDDGTGFKTSSNQYSLKKLSVGEHSFTVRAVLVQYGRTILTDWSPVIEQNVADVTAPKTGKLTMVQSGDTAVRLDWIAATDNVGIDHYIVECGGETRIVSSGDLRAEFSGVGVGKIEVRITSVDLAGNAGNVVKKTLTVADWIAPAQVVGLTALEVNNKSGGILTWEAASDNVGVSQYEVVLNGKTYKTGKASLKISKLPAGSHSYQVYAVDKAKNRSIVSEEGSFAVADVIDPKISKFSAKVICQTVQLSWKATDETGGLTASLFMDDRFAADVTGLETYKFEGLELGKHTFELRVSDSSGNGVGKLLKSTISKLSPSSFSAFSALPSVGTPELFRGMSLA